MNRTIANTVLALNFACLSLMLNGCQQQPQAQPQPEITVEVRVPPPTIITREIYLPSEKQTAPVTQHVCEKDKDLPSAPETTETTEEQEVETADASEDKPKQNTPEVASVPSAPSTTPTSVTDTLVAGKPAETARIMPDADLQ